MANRKLLSEIERTLKKVDEGVDIFDEIWDKVYAASTQSQKEKYELDLKKEIKKLQRLRDQIKTWAAGNEIKDKSKLLDARRLIETKMEQFKVCERETKTKAYSREGLAKASRLDPEEKKRAEMRDWIQEKLQEIQDQVEMKEADIEALTTKKGKKDQNAIGEALEMIARHTWHIEQLEMVTRALDNCIIGPEEVEEVKDEIEYYIESNQDPDFYHDDQLYEQLELERKLGESGQIVTVDVVVPEKNKKKDKDDDMSNSSEQDSKESPESTKKSKKEKKKAEKKKEEEARKTAHEKLLAQQQERQRLIQKQKEAQKAKKEQQRREREQQQLEAQQKARQEQLLQQKQAQQQAQQQEQAKKQEQQQQKLREEQIAKQRQQVQQQELARQQVQMQQQQQEIQKQALEQQQIQKQALEQQQIQKQALEQQQIQKQALEHQQIQKQALEQQQLRVESTPIVSGSEHTQQLSLLESSLVHIPTSTDSERPKVYVPQRPCAIPASFPASPTPLFESPLMFEKLDVDTLILIFYYQQGTYQQYLAARELKRKSWRYHKKYLTWFQRHEEPKVTTDEYEIGTYVYFDYETGWCQRIKSDFTFEYPYLEDELQPAPK